jgi:hypothetical protein
MIVTSSGEHYIIGEDYDEFAGILDTNGDVDLFDENNGLLTQYEILCERRCATIQMMSAILNDILTLFTTHQPGSLG